MSNKRLKVSHGGSGISLCSSSLSAEVPSASICDLPNDLLKYCFAFIPGSYVTIAPVCKQFFGSYITLGIHESAAFSSPDVLLKVGRNRRTTADAVSNDVKLTEYCFTGRFHDQKMLGYKKFVMIKFAEEGNLEMIQYFDSKLGEHFDKHTWIDMFNGVVDSFRKRLHIMKWIFEEKGHLIEDYININGAKSFIEAYEHVLEGVTAPRVKLQLCAYAAECGNIELLEYCHRNNYLLDVDDAYDGMCIYALENDHKEKALETLKWLRHHGCGWKEEFCKEAVSHNNLEVLKWAREDGCPWDQCALVAAIEYGNIAIIEYCLQNQCPMTTEICSSAMSIEDHNVALEVLKLLRKYSAHGMRVSVPMLFQEVILKQCSVLSDHSSNVPCVIEKLKLLREYGYQWNTNTSAEAANHNKLRVLQWLRHAGCSMDADTCTAASCKGNIEMLKYAHEVAGCRLSKEAYEYCFAEHGLDEPLTTVRDSHKKILKYLKKNDCPKPKKSD
ncbi:hypothetical protein CTEN210_04113 [Chaetoceros tenuissimus]|uniref:Uncharacterized protein n=1 Tax=Chaetoceros tenuissimus TaxID=426638 RepID=A0AAD3CL91_9STRA|nr:hypothetical protein CTEN210_04113 [Chaetoceros tenuissimus]